VKIQIFKKIFKNSPKNFVGHQQLLLEIIHLSINAKTCTNFSFGSKGPTKKVAFFHTWASFLKRGVRLWGILRGWQNF